MNRNTDPGMAATKGASQHVTPKNNTKNSSSLSQSAGTASAETSLHGMSRNSGAVDEALSNEDITSMDSLFDVDDASADVAHDDKASVNGSDTAGLTQNGSDVTDELVLGKIPVEIIVELGSFIVDAANSSTLSAGDVLKLNTVCPGQVRLMCDDAEVGRGELVDINGQLGVQIVHNWSH